MNKKVPNTVAAAIIASILIVLGCWAYFGDTIFRQQRRMKLAREHLPAISNVVHSHPEFRDVTVGVGTGAGGCFLVLGMVETDKSLSDLQRIIAAQKPLVTVVYKVKILETYSNANFDAKP